MTSPQRPADPHDRGTVEASTAPPPESAHERFIRHGHRARLYAGVVLFVALLAFLIVVISANTRKVKLSWAFGSTNASLVWIILAAAVIGWLLGVVTAVVLRHRTHRPR